MGSQLQGNLEPAVDGFVAAEGSRSRSRSSISMSIDHVWEHIDSNVNPLQENEGFQLKETTPHHQLPLALPSTGRQQRKKRDMEKTPERRQKRMIKNRESAARSRARRQAYTNELEIEVTHLIEENAKLRMQLDSESLIPASHSQQMKNILRRTLTAPF